MYVGLCLIRKFTEIFLETYSSLRAIFGLGLLGWLLALAHLPLAADEPRVAELYTGIVNAVICTDKTSAAKRCVVSNLEKTSGTAFVAKIPSLQPGTYLAVIRLKVAKVNDINTGPLQWRMVVSGAATAERVFDMLLIERAGEYQEVTLPISVERGGATELSLSWKRDRGVRVAKNNLPKMRADFAMGALEEDGELPSIDEEPPLASLNYLYMAVDHIQFRPVGDLVVGSLAADKTRYTPGQKPIITIQLRNYAAHARTVQVVTELVQDLDNVIPVDMRTVSVAPSGVADLVLTGPELSQRWGYELRCRVLENDREITRRSEYFTVHENLWAVMIAGKAPAQFTANITQESARKSAQWNKEHYSNWVESGFWAPDEFGDFTPDTERWWSGQGCYYGSVQGTKWMIEEGHKTGIGFSLYSNIWGGDGPPAFEMARRYPEMARPGKYNVEWLDRWHRNSVGQDSSRIGLHVWPYTIILRDNPEAFKLHGRQLIATHRMFGWDAVRYDSHEICAANARDVGIAKEVVHAELPGFQFGYNSSVPGDQKELIPAFREQCLGEGLIMEEGTRDFAKDKCTYRQIAERILDMKTQARHYGGHFAAIGADRCNTNDLLYQYIFWLAANTHPCYQWNSVCVADYYQFATRYAGQFWDLAVTEVPDPARWIDVGAAKEFLWLWERYVHQRDLGNGHRQLILHLINAPTETVLFTNEDCNLPPLRKDTSLSMRLPEGAKVRALWLLSAEPKLSQQKLPYKEAEGCLSFTVPSLRFWSVVVADLEQTGAFQ